MSESRANPVGHLQLVNGLRTRGETPTRVTHPLVLLVEAYRRERPPDGTDPLDGGNRPAARRIDR